MEEPSAFDELVRLLTAMGIEIRIEPFHNPPARAGGYCRIEGQGTVLLDSGANQAQQAQALLEALEGMGPDALARTGINLSPALLRRLHRRGRIRWPRRARPLKSPPSGRAGG